MMKLASQWAEHEMMGVSDCSSSTTLSTMVADHVHDQYECDPLEALDVRLPYLFFFTTMIMLLRAQERGTLEIMPHILVPFVI
jgi:hypothetical protein